MIWKPHATVSAVVERNQRFLMVEEYIRGQLQLNQPAGHLEDKESLQDAVLRETLEETAWSITPRHITGVYTWRDHPRERTFLRVNFAADANQFHQHLKLDPAIHQAVWLSYDEIISRQQQHRSPLVMQCLKDYRAGRCYDLNLLKHLS